MSLRSAMFAVAAALAAGPAGPAWAAGDDGLDPTPLVAEAIGLEMSVPAGSVVTTQMTDTGLVYLLADGGPAPTWSMRISTLTPPGEGTSAAGIIGAHLEAVQQTGRKITVKANEPRSMGGIEGHVLFLEQVQDDQRRLVNGWVILPTSDRKYVVLSILAEGDRFPQFQPVLDACLASIKLATEGQLEAERKAQLEAGRAVILTFTPARLKSMVGPTEFFRIYQPSESGRVAEDREVGFLSMHCLDAMRGQLEPDRSSGSFGSFEAERGLMVIIEARAILNAESSTYLDVEGRYWMSWDRTEEAWSVRQTQRQGDASRTSAETGVRNIAGLDVIHSSKEEFTRDPSHWTIPDNAYLSQPEVFLLGRLLPRGDDVPGPMAFFFYESASRHLAQRIDRWERSGDAPGQWTLSTQSVLKPGTVTQTFDAHGRRLKRVDADGTVTQRIDGDELRRIWKAKGLIAR